MWVVLLLLASLCTECSAVSGFFDVRCLDPSLSFDTLDSKKLFELEIDSRLYLENQTVRCVKSKALPDLQPSDNWSYIISSIKKLLNETGPFKLNCKNLPQYVKNLHVYLQHEDSYFDDNCGWALDFCSTCGGCPTVSDAHLSNYTNTISWAHKEATAGKCEDNWAWDNCREAIIWNASWYYPVREQCELCWDGACDSEFAMTWYKKVLHDLGNNHSAWRRLCHSISLFGCANSLHLQDIYGSSDYWKEQMTVFSHHNWITNIVHISWTTMISLVLIFTDWCDPGRTLKKKFSEDPVLAYIVRTLGAGKNRKARNARRVARKAKKLLKKKTKKGGNKNKKKGRKSTGKAEPVKTLVLGNGKIIGARRGPGGKAGRGRGGRIGRGPRGGRK